MNNSINGLLALIKTNLLNEINQLENKKLRVLINENESIENININGTLFITYKGEKLSENLYKSNLIYSVKRKVFIEIIGVIKEENKANFNDYIDFVLFKVSGLKTASGLGSNYVLPLSTEILKQDEYGNLRFIINFIAPCDLNFTGVQNNETN
jgi:hypothetical protein